MSIAALGMGGFLLSFADRDSAQPAARIDGVIRRHELPITSTVHWSAKEQRAMADAGYLLTSGCLAHEGFDMPRDPYATPLLDDRRYGITDMNSARLWGYGLPPSQIVDDSASSAYIGSLDPARSRVYDIAAFGTDDQQIPVGSGGTTMPAGCVGEARDTIFGSRAVAVRAEELRELAEELENGSLSSSEADARVEAAIADWSGCMAVEGFDVAHPYHAALLAPEGSVEATDIAVADVRCKDESDLVEIWSGVEAEIQGGLMVENGVSMNELAALRQQAADNAATIVTGASAR